MAMNPNKIIISLLLLLMFGFFSGCSDDKQGKGAQSNEDRAAEMQRIVRETETYAQQEEVRKQASEQQQERALLIGIVGPETGEESEYGMGVVNGVLAAARQFNSQGGIAGKEIKVLHFDDENNMANTSKIVSYLIEQGAVAIMSAPTGSATFSPIHIVNKSETIYVSIGTRRHIERSGPFVFRSAIPDDLATEDLMKYAINTRGYVNYALVTSSNHDFSLDLSSHFKKALYKYHGQIKVETDTYDAYTGGSNMAAVIDAIKGCPEALQGVIFTGGAQEGIELAKNLKASGVKLPILAGEDFYSPDYLQGGEAVDGTLLYATFSPDLNPLKMQDLLKNYSGNGSPDRFVALAYDTFMLIAEAIRAAGSTNTSKVKEMMVSRRDFDGVTGKFGFNSEGTPLKSPVIYEVKKGAAGEEFVALKK